MAEKKNVVSIDPDLYYKRRLSYEEKHSGWTIFKCIFGGIYLFVIGMLLLMVISKTQNYAVFLGWGSLLLAFFVIVYGFAKSLHLKLMKSYA